MSLLANHNRPKVQPGIIDRLRHRPQHSASRFGGVAAATLVPKLQEAQARQQEKTRQRGRHLERIAKAGAHLVQKVMGGNNSPRREKQMTPLVAEVPKAIETPRAVPIAQKVEEAKNRIELIMLKGTAVSPGANKSIMTRAETQEKYGLNVGSLQAIVHHNAVPEPLLCFNDTTIDENGDKKPRYHIMTASQLDKIRQLEEAGDHGAAIDIWAQTVDLNVTNPRFVISPDHRMPGTRVASNRLLRPYEKNDVINAVTDPSLRGGVEFFINRSEGNLNIGDLDNPNGTFVEFSPTYIDPQDPWPDSPAGTIFDPGLELSYIDAHTHQLNSRH